jgi:diguanylate cyclase
LPPRSRAVAAALCLIGGSAIGAQGPGPLPGAPTAPPHRGLAPPRFSRADPPKIEGVVAATLRPGAGGSLAGMYYYLEDSSGEMTIADVRSPELAGQFQLARRDSINLGFTDSVLWLRIDVRRLGQPGRDGMLTLDYPLLDRIEVYDGSTEDLEPMLRLGDRQPFEQRVVPHRYFAVPLPREGFYWNRIYLRIESESSLQVRPGLTSGRDLMLSSIREEFLFGLAYGVMILMAIYNLFLFFQLRDRTYLLYVGSTVSGVLFMMCLNGHAFRYLWPGMPDLANRANPLLVSLWLLATAGFARCFLEPSRRSRAVAVVVDGLIVLGLISAVFALVASYRPAMMFSSGAATLNAVILLVCGAVMWLCGQRVARFFTLAWIGLGLGTFSLSVSRFGWMPDNGFTHHSALVGGVLEILFLSLALSDKYRLLQVELAGYSRNLESMVDQRTRQLAEANETLQQLAITDVLTGLANRRHFEETLEREVKRHRRLGSPLSLAIVDIDHFKEFNDRHGHQHGDACLRQVAEAIGKVARRPSDLIARYGGEEFAVLLPDTDRRGAARIGEGIRRAVGDLELPCRVPDDPRAVTVSVGLTTWSPDEVTEGDELVAAADRALYEAKRAGRDRVVVG